MAQLVSVSASDTNNKVQSSNPPERNFFFDWITQFSNKIEIHLNNKGTESALEKT